MNGISHNSAYFPGNATGLVSGSGDPVTLGAGVSLTSGILAFSGVGVSAAVKPLRLSHHGYIRWQGGQSFNQGASGNTYAALFSIPGAFRYTRLFFLNTTTTVASVGNVILMGATARSDYLYPVDASGNAIASGFGGMQSVGFDQGSLSSATGITATFHPAQGNIINASSSMVPAASGVGNHTLGKSWTDWAYTASIAPQDGGRFYYLNTVIDTPSFYNTLVTGPSFDQGNNGFNSYSSGIASKMRAAYVSGSSSGNLAALNTAANSGNASYGSSIVSGIEVIFEQKALTIITVGDSLSDSPHAGLYSGAEAAASFMTRDSGIPVCCYNMSMAGVDVQGYTQLALAEINTVHDAGVILIQSQSSNTDSANADGNQAFFNDLQRGCVLALVAAAETLGMFVVIVGPSPAAASAFPAYLAMCQAQAVSAKAYGHAYLDRDVIWGYGDGSMRQDPQWWDSVTLSPTPAGLQREGVAIQALLAPYLPSSVISVVPPSVNVTRGDFSSDFSSDFSIAMSTAGTNFGQDFNKDFS